MAEGKTQEKQMAKNRRFLFSTGILFLALLAVLTCLGSRLSAFPLNRVRSYHADGSRLYGAIPLGDFGPFLLCQNDFRTGKCFCMTLPGRDEEGNRYVLRQVQKESAGKAAVFMDVYDQDQLLSSKIWLCRPKEKSIREIFSYEYGQGEKKDDLMMISDSGGILVLKFVHVNPEKGEDWVSRIYYQAGQYDAPRELKPLRVLYLTSGISNASYGQGIWYSDRYGNVRHCQEDGSIVEIMKNDGTQVSIHNVDYSLTRNGFYFYNLDNKKNYWVGADGILKEFDSQVLDDFRAQGFEVRKIAIDRDGVLYANLRRGNEPIQLGVMAQGEEPVLLSEIRLPVSLWLSAAVLASLILALGISLLAHFLYRFYKKVRVIPVSVKIAAAATLVLILGGAALSRQVYRVFYGNHLKSTKTMLTDAARLEAREINQAMLARPEAGYFEDRAKRLAAETWSLENLQTGGQGRYRREYVFEYFEISGDDAYPILDTQYVTIPARASLTKDELAILEKTMENKSIFCGVYMVNGFEYLAGFCPVLSEEGLLKGAVKCYLRLDTIKQEAMRDAFFLSSRILLGFGAIILVLLFLVHRALKPLRELSVLIRDLETQRSWQDVKARGRNEISQLVGIVSRMWENIREYMDRVQALKDRYDAFVPEDLVALFGTGDIRALKPGDTAVCPAVLLLVNMAGFERLQGETGADEMFRLINQGLEIMIPRGKGQQGHIVRFYQGGMLLLFPDGWEQAARCAADMMAALREASPVPYFAAMDCRSVNLELIGNESRMDFSIRLEDWELAWSLQKMAEAFHLGVLAAGEPFGGSQEREKVSGIRWLGTAFWGEEGRTEPIYEFYMDNGQELFLLKEETRGLFEEGVRLFDSKELLKSRECFAKILRKNSRDTAAGRYFDLCDRMLEEGEKIKHGAQQLP